MDRTVHQPPVSNFARKFNSGRDAGCFTNSSARLESTLTDSKKPDQVIQQIPGAAPKGLKNCCDIL